MAAPAVVVPRRFSVGDDPRVIAANELFDRIVELIAEGGLTPLLVDYPFVALSDVGGLVLPGGGDINPQRYGQGTTAAVYDVNDAQDDLDFILAARAQDAGLSVLGICLAFNGVAVALSQAELALVQGWDEVVLARPQTQYHPLIHGGPRWIGADGVWNGTTTGGLPGTSGEGVIVGVLDTGI